MHLTSILGTTLKGPHNLCLDEALTWSDERCEPQVRGDFPRGGGGVRASS